MDNVWLLLIWLIVTAILSFAYSFAKLLRADPNCFSNEGHLLIKNFVEFMNRILDY